MDLSDDKKAWKPFVIYISLVILLFIQCIFIGLLVRNNQLVEQEILTRARSDVANIVLTRRWNAGYGGVFVEKKEGMESNPYLKNPDIHTVDGKVYTMKNPALMTREISEYAKSSGQSQFHITSLKPLNPSNKPDSFEREALNLFEIGQEKEFFAKVTKGDSTIFRYMAPLITEQSCLECHAEQGYQEGDLRGGISVSFDITHVEGAMRESMILYLLLGVGTTVMLLAIIYSFIYRLVKRLKEIQLVLVNMAIKDELTKLFNRRYFFDRLDGELNRARRNKTSVGCLMLDLDYFKKVNDSYGHRAGDIVLERFGKLLKDSCRTSDVAARYGGEEFVVLLPETDAEGVMNVGEKIRRIIARQDFLCPKGKRFKITVSVGAITFSPNGDEIEVPGKELLCHADEALYAAKAAGRNQVRYWEPAVE